MSLFCYLNACTGQCAFQNCYTVMSHLTAHFGSQGFGSDKRNMRITDTPNIMHGINYQDSAQPKRTDHETNQIIENWIKKTQYMINISVIVMTH